MGALDHEREPQVADGRERLRRSAAADLERRRTPVGEVDHDLASAARPARLRAAPGFSAPCRPTACEQPPRRERLADRAQHLEAELARGRAPRARARYSSSPLAITIAVPATVSATWRRNSTPSIPGMSRSQTTMSTSREQRQRAVPVGRLQQRTHAEVGEHLQRRLALELVVLDHHHRAVGQRHRVPSPEQPERPLLLDGLLAGGDAELSVQRARVRLDRVARDEQLVGDLAQAARPASAASTSISRVLSSSTPSTVRRLGGLACSAPASRAPAIRSSAARRPPPRHRRPRSARVRAGQLHAASPGPSASVAPAPRELQPRQAALHRVVGPPGERLTRAAAHVTGNVCGAPRSGPASRAATAALACAAAVVDVAALRRDERQHRAGQIGDERQHAQRAERAARVRRVPFGGVEFGPQVLVPGGRGRGSPARSARRRGSAARASSAAATRRRGRRSTAAPTGSAPPARARRCRRASGRPSPRRRAAASQASRARAVAVERGEQRADVAQARRPRGRRGREAARATRARGRRARPTATKASAWRASSSAARSHSRAAR